jgi:N-acetylglucosamine kinase-like BadF-type ATPase
MTRYFLGMDVGGTKTHALVADENGEVVGFGQAGGGNPEGRGYDGLTSVMESALNQALRMAGIRLARLAGAGFGIGGYDWPCDDLPTRQAIRPLRLNCPIEIANDTILGLLAGSEQGWGLVLVAGTGGNCRGRNRQGQEGRVTGEGENFGEFGGSSELVWRAVHAVNYAWMQRSPPTQLTAMFLELTSARSAFELLEGIARDKIQLNPDWARAIFQVAQSGDTAARELIAFCGGELGEMACAVIRQLNLEEESFDIVLTGSMFKGGSLLVEPAQQKIQVLAPGARLVRLEVPPVVGGVLLGLQAAGREQALSIDWSTYRARLIESIKRLMVDSGG